MPLFMTQFAYTAEAWAALTRRQEDRSRAFAALVEKSGGTFHSQYYTFGEFDGLVIYEAPDEVTAMSTLMALVTPGHLKAVRTTLLLTVPEAVEAMTRAGGLVYRAPSDTTTAAYHDGA